MLLVECRLETGRLVIGHAGFLILHAGGRVGRRRIDAGGVEGNLARQRADFGQMGAYADIRMDRRICKRDSSQNG